MNKSILIISSVVLTALYSLNALADTKPLYMNCQADSGDATISGYPRGENYDLKIKKDGYTLRFGAQCKDISCSKMEYPADLFVVDALSKNVFTIYFNEFTDSGEVFMGYFYALPNSVHYTKTANGYHAQYKGLYDGADPSSSDSPQKQVDAPIPFTCTQQEGS